MTYDETQLKTINDKPLDFSKLENPDNWEIYRHDQWYSIRGRARRKGIRFTITPNDIVYPELCPILQIPITRKLGNDNKPSLDRVNCKLGYVKGNVRIISQKANRMKQDNDLETLLRLVSYMRGEL